jgi:cutinase
MNARQIAFLLGAAAVMGWALPTALAPSATAQPCPDVDVVFARGTTEAPGVGATGGAFVNALRPRLGGRSMDVYAVNYPATTDFATGYQGLYDEKAHIESEAASCPQTKMVLGGFSQGAAIAGFATSAEIPAGVDPADVPKPLAPDVANHVAAVTLFGTPSNKFMNQINQPHIVIGPAFAAKTIEICAPGDPVCADGGDWAAHTGYAVNGTVDQAADFAVSHLGPPPAGQPAPPPPSPGAGLPGGPEQGPAPA